MGNLVRAMAGAALALTAALTAPAAALAADTQPMYRLYNPNGGEHFYTASVGEHNTLVFMGWRSEGTGWTAPVTSGTPVHRLYNPNSGDHHYTTSSGERDLLVKAGWKSEGVGWYSDDAMGAPLYRQYNPNAKTGSHNFTASAAERDMLVRSGWRDEGIGWYGVKTNANVVEPTVRSARDAYNALLDQSAGAYVGYGLVEISGDNIPEIILKPDTSAHSSYNDYPIYWYDSSNGNVSNVGVINLHLTRGYLAVDRANHTVNMLQLQGDNYYYFNIAHWVENGTLVHNDGTDALFGKEGVYAAGLEFVSVYDISDRGPINAL